MTNEEFCQISEILERVSKPSKKPVVALAVSQLLLVVAFVFHFLGVLF